MPHPAFVLLNALIRARGNVARANFLPCGRNNRKCSLSIYLSLPIFAYIVYCCTLAYNLAACIQSEAQSQHTPLKKNHYLGKAYGVVSDMAESVRTRTADQTAQV